ncbi:MAG TPA: multicopper oxidase domain-containing protein [Acetobacteraceae bacterium]|nr:multicopper oxidase domain-containing protein [Acetobacteraceae bacterium]
MPILPVKAPITPNQMTAGPLLANGTRQLVPVDGTTLIDGATQRINHQLFTVNEDGTFGGTFPPQKFYQFDIRETQIRLNPAYELTTFWGFDGQVPGPVIQATYGEPALVRYQNNLPSVKIAQDFGIAEVTTHLHNAHTPTESDGNPVDYFNSSADTGPINPTTNKPVNPLGYKDQHYPNVYAGYVKLGNASTNSIATPAGDPTEALGSLWYHDHHLDFTAQNVYKGMFGCYTLFDALDTGDETTGLRLPSGKYDIPIFFNDFVIDQDYQLVFDLFNLDGIIGDRFAANGAIQPYLNVDQRRYRFRLYNPGPSRWYEFALYDGSKFWPFWQISTDGNLLPQAVQVSSVRMGVSERVDIIVDFSKISAPKLYLVNRLEQVNGRGPTGRVLTPGTPIVMINIGGLPAQRDQSVDPAAKPLTLRPLPDPDFKALQSLAAKARVRNWVFDQGDSGTWVVNDELFDPNRISASIDQESEEVWVFQNPEDNWSHPIHVHFEEHRVLSRNGKTVTPNTQFNGAIDYARRDVAPLQQQSQTKVFFRFRDMKGRYVMHCHNVVHEDHAMMVRFDIV